MKFKETVILLAVLAIGCGIGSGAGLWLYSHTQSPAPQAYGSASDNVLRDQPNATKVFVNSSDTLVVASSSGRAYLQLDNISGATSIPQVVSCNYGDRPATLYSGFQIIASSSKVFNLDNLYRGAIHCIAPANGATIGVTDF